MTMWNAFLFFKGFRAVFLYILSFCVFLSSSCFSEEQSFPPKIYFLHLAKTGGSSLFQFLADHYSATNVFEPSVSEASNLNNSSALLCRSHRHYFQVHSQIPKKEWKIVTLLRNPIERVLSHQRFIQLYGFNSYVPDNYMCLCLTKLNFRDSAIRIEEHLESAKKTLLEDVFFIAILEKFEESLYLLAKKLGWSPPLENIHTNTTKELYQSYAPEIIDEIMKNNSADLELYEFALTLFEKQKQEIHGLLDCIQAIPSPCSEIYYTCDQPLEGAGWCRRILEKSPEQPSHWVRYFTNKPQLQGSMRLSHIKFII